MKKFIVRLLLIAAGLLPAVAPHLAHAIDLGRVDNDALTSGLNLGQMNVFSRYRAGTQLLTNQKRAVRCMYSYSMPGGATTGALTLLSSTTYSGDTTTQPCIIPKGAIVTTAYLDGITTLTSSGFATVALSTGETAGDLLAALDYNNSKFLGGASHPAALIPVGTAATALKMTADRNPTATVAVAALTAGKFYVLIEYLLSQTL